MEQAYIIKFINPSDKPDFEKILDEHKNHPLVKRSKEVLETVNSDKEHNEILVGEGLTTHYGSRANNVISSSVYETLTKETEHSKSHPLPMNGRPVQLSNLCQLKSGPHKDAYLGANLIDFAKYTGNEKSQKYIATEAPYFVDDYFRMIIDTDSKILVSLTTNDDIQPNNVFEKIRGDKDNIEKHHLKADTIIEFDDYIVKLENEIQNNNILIKELKISSSQSTYKIHHIIYKDWYDGKFAEHPENIIDLLKAIRFSEHELDAHFYNPITVNCGYGYGRTAIMILADQIARMIENDIESGLITQNNYKNVSVELQPMIYSIQKQIAYGALSGLPGEKAKRSIELYSDKFQQIIEVLIKENFENLIC